MAGKQTLRGMARRYERKHQKRRAWQKLVSVLACVTVFCTVYALILPAITMTRETLCGLEEHTHTEACYGQVLTCGLEEEPEGHVHTEDCYETALLCGLEEHTHDESCWAEPEPILAVEDALVYGLDGAAVEKTVLASDGRQVTVRVSFGPEAQLPEDAELAVQTYESGTAEYEAAYRAVLEDKLAKGELADGAEMALTAFDISLLTPAGEPLEPAAPVQVELNIHALEGVEDLSQIEDSLEIQHHVETEEGLIIETVAEGSADVSFETEGFSTFTVTWVGTTETPRDGTFLRWKFDSEPNNTRGGIEIKYVLVDDENKILTYINAPGASDGVTWNPNSQTQEQVLYFNGSINDKEPNKRSLVYNILTGEYTLDFGEPQTKTTSIIAPQTISGAGDLVGVFYDVDELATGTTLATKVDTITSWYDYDKNNTNGKNKETEEPYSLREGGRTGYAIYATLSLNGEEVPLKAGKDYTKNGTANSEVVITKGTSVPYLMPGYDAARNWSYACATLYVAYKQTQPTNQVTVHHGYIENGEFVEFTATPWGSGNPDSTGKVNDNSGRKYLIYDFDRYYYASAHLNSHDGTAIQPVLNRGTSGYQYCTDLNNANGTWQNFDGNGQVYVVYEKRTEPTKGGTPKVEETLSRPLETPTIQKTSIHNNDDGTNTLSLSITGHASQMKAEKLADVIVVMDISTSMLRNNMSDNRSRMVWAKEVINNLAADLLTKVNSKREPLVRMSLVSFGDYARVVYGLEDNSTVADSSAANLASFQAAVNGLGSLENTNWEAALETANTMSVDPERATFVLFITDGDPTVRVTRGGGDVNYSDSVLAASGEINIASMRQYGMFGNGGVDPKGDDYNYALSIGKSIVAQNKYFYTIGVSNDVKNLTKFYQEVKNSTTNQDRVANYSASDGDQLKAAFADIQASILAQVGWSNVKMVDGITDLTSMTAKTKPQTDGAFTYWIAPAPVGWETWSVEQRANYKPAESDFQPWTLPASCNPAEYEKDSGSVVWDMGPNFMPQDGVTYRVSFQVWPSQKAYDILAKLNNGTLQYNKLDAATQAQIVKTGDSYTLVTNKPNPTTTFQKATQKEGTITVSGEEKTLPFGTVKNLNLNANTVTVQKKWQNDLDAHDKFAVTMSIKADGEPFKEEIALNAQNGWQESVSISCGLLTVDKTAGTVTVYEAGHDFQLAEENKRDYYWELDAAIYHPMLVNNTMTMLKQTAAPAGMTGNYYKDGDTEYYRINGNVYQTVGADGSATITATNVRRSNLNLTKQLVDVDDESKTVTGSVPFQFTVTVNDAARADVWFSVQTDASDTSTVIKNLTVEGATAEVNESGEKTGYYSAKSGTPINVTLQPGWNLRFTNLPSGSTFTVVEEKQTDYTFQGATIYNDATLTVDKENASVYGEIEEPNKQYTVTVTNKAVALKVSLRKTKEDGETPLSGAVFALYSKEGYEADPKVTLQTGLQSGAEGLVDLGKLTPGDYVLEETQAPSGYSLLKDPINLSVSADKITGFTVPGFAQSEKSVTGNAKDGFILTVPNFSGYRLPATGGNTERPFVLLGLGLMTAAVLLGFLLRRRSKGPPHPP